VVCPRRREDYGFGQTINFDLIRLAVCYDLGRI
jgi:hypothetical protein